MDAARRIGIIGSVNRDTIAHADGTRTQGWGGILYTAAALSALGGGGLQCWLLCRLGRDAERAVHAFLGAFPEVRGEGVVFAEEANYHSHITYRADGSKEERLTGELAPLTQAELAPFSASLHGLLVNFITGFEVELEVLADLRKGLAGPLLMDIHSLTLGRRPSGERFWRCPEQWQRWVELADVVQMNEAEAALLGGFAEGKASASAQFARHLLELGPWAAVITRGREGALAAWRDAQGVHLMSRRAEGPERAVDPTGCGDVFLAGLAAGLFKGCGLTASVELAVRAAGLNSRLRGVEALAALQGMSPAADTT